MGEPKYNMYEGKMETTILFTKPNSLHGWEVPKEIVAYIKADALRSLSTCPNWIGKCKMGIRIDEALARGTPE